MDDATAFDAALLAEVARLLPEADVVHVVERPTAVPVVPVATARRRVEDAARLVAAHVVAAWPAAYPEVEPPGHVAVELGLVDRGRVRVAATAVRRGDDLPADLNPEDTASGLAGIGWTSQRRRAAAGSINVLGVRGALRLDAVARPPALFALRVTTAPIEVGELAKSVAQQPRRHLPWTAFR